MEPMYGIPATIRYALVGLTRWDSAELVEAVLEDVRELLIRHASKLNAKQVRENIEYITNLEESLNGLVDYCSQMGITLSDDTIKYYSKLGINLTKDGVSNEDAVEEKEEEKEIEYTSEQKFYRHVLADYKKEMSAQLTIYLLTLKVLAMAKAELERFLQDNNVSNGGDKSLQKIDSSKNDMN